MSKPRWTALLLAALVGLTAADCPKKTVVIHYRPLANTSDITSNGAHAAAEAGIFRIYRIYQIDNLESDAQTFAFEASKVYLRKPNKAELLHVRKDGGVPYSDQSASLDVAPHTSAKDLQIYLVMWDSQPPPAGSDDWVPLRYNNSGGESLLLVQDPKDPKPVFKQAMTSADLPVEP